MTVPVESQSFTTGGVPYTNSDGEMGLQSGRVETIQLSPSIPTSWVQRTHPSRMKWCADECRQRASYIGTRRQLSPFLVPHRFEGNEKPADLSRAKLGYAIGLNSAYLQEIFGHIRNAPAHYCWGPLGAPEDDDIVGGPSGDPALKFWEDVTGDGVTWTNFFEGTVLEWMLTSVGGFVLVDSNKPALTVDKRTASKVGIRSSLKFIPMSAVEDFGRGPRGYRWIKIAETFDERQPDMKGDDTGYRKHHVIYSLEDDGRTKIERFNDKGEKIGGTIYQTITDMDEQGILPLVPVTFGEHPDMNYLGSGLLMGLDEIVIDLYNLVTEVREAYRDAVFTFLSYRGADMAGVQDQLKSGTRLVHIGDDPTAELARVGAEGNEVDAGLKLIDMGVTNWALSAKRRSSETGGSAGGNAKSGNAFKAEFQLDLIPLMVTIGEALDAIETSCMFVLAQMEGNSNVDADECEVKREKDFQMEQEATRIARIVSEFLQAIPGMPAVLLEKMIMRWANSIDFLDMDEEVDDGEGNMKPLGEVLAEQAQEIALADQQARILQNQFGILGSAALGKTLGGDPSKPGMPGMEGDPSSGDTPPPKVNGRGDPATKGADKGEELPGGPKKDQQFAFKKPGANLDRTGRNKKR